ncbi:MAG: DUF104 domain-containing protein [Caldilineaceae bacterium]|nr:DUF104 domain-containing protein [Caldilineaceae bacterium]
MSVQTIDAIYEKGIFRILSPRKVALTDGQAVRLTLEVTDVEVEVEGEGEGEVSPLLQCALHIFDGLDEDDVEEVERIALARQPFFSARAAIE